jgi:hypothetical protein
MEGPAARAKFIARIIGFHVLRQIIELHVAASYHHLRVGVVLDVVRAEPRVLVADIHVAIRVEDSAGLLLLVCFEGGFASSRGEPERSFRADLGEDPRGSGENHIKQGSEARELAKFLRKLHAKNRLEMKVEPNMRLPLPQSQDFIEQNFPGQKIRGVVC